MHVTLATMDPLDLLDNLARRRSIRARAGEFLSNLRYRLMGRRALLRAVTRHYLRSGDFNGLPVPPTLRQSVVTNLIRRGVVSLNRGDRHPNPHIKALEPEPVDDQVAKIRTGGLEGCLYPEPRHLERVVDRSQYDGCPFSLRLALGQPQLSHCSFALNVLEHYRNDPRYSFSVSDVDGSMSVRDKYFESDLMEERDQTFLQTFGFSYDENMRRAVAVFLRYLHDLTPEHQRIWEAHLLDGRFALHPDYHAASMGHWPEKMPILVAFCEEIHQINEMCRLIGRPTLFRREFQESDRPREFTFLLRPTLKAFNEFVHLLDKMLSENIDVAFFENDVPLERDITRPDGKVVVERKGTLQVLAEWLDKAIKLPDPTPKDEMIKTFRAIRKMRQQPAHTTTEDEFDESYFAKQRELIIDAYKAIRTMRLLLANHPATKSHKVPEWLYKGHIRNF